MNNLIKKMLMIVIMLFFLILYLLVKFMQIIYPEQRFGGPQLFFIMANFVL